MARISVNEFTQLFLKHAEAINSVGKPTPQSLAYGVCFYYAYVFRKILGGELWTHMTPDGAAHAFVKFHDQFFDGGNLQGADHWKSMTHLHRSHSQYLHPNQPIQQFLSTWEIDTQTLQILDKVTAKIKREMRNR